MEARILGRLEDVGRHVVSAVVVSCARANRCVAAEAVKDLAAHGALRVLGRSGMRRQCCRPVRMRSASQSKRGTRALPQATLPRGDLVEFGGDPVSLDACAIRVLSVWASHSLDKKDRTAQVPRCNVVDGGLKLDPSGHIRVRCGIVGVPEAVATGWRAVGGQKRQLESGALGP